MKRPGVLTWMIIGGNERSLVVGREIEHARAMTLITLSLASVMLTIILSGFSRRMSHIMVAITIIVAILLVQVPGLAALIHITPLHLDDWIISIVAVLGIAVLVFIGQFGRKL